MVSVSACYQFGPGSRPTSDTNFFSNNSIDSIFWKGPQLAETMNKETKLFFCCCYVLDLQSSVKIATHQVLSPVGSGPTLFKLLLFTFRNAEMCQKRRQGRKIAIRADDSMAFIRPTFLLRFPAHPLVLVIEFVGIDSHSAEKCWVFILDWNTGFDHAGNHGGNNELKVKFATFKSCSSLIFNSWNSI